MEFGRIADIENIRWELPVPDPLGLEYLRSLEPQAARFYVGTPAWGHRDWVGKIYPAGAKSTDYLRYYARSFNTIELNTSHYRIPTGEQTLKWCEQVPDDFLFCPKLPQSISHRPGGLLDASLLREWLTFLENLETHAGPSFLQLPPSFDYSHKATLFHFLQKWPREFDLAVEFRHPSWFQEGRILPALTQYLQNRWIGLVITDVAGRRDVLHASVSAPFLLLRFIGNDLHPSDYLRLHQWAERLAQWREAGLQKVFFFVHEPDDLKAPEMAQSVILELNESCGADLSPLQWVL